MGKGHVEKSGIEYSSGKEGRGEDIGSSIGDMVTRIPLNKKKIRKKKKMFPFSHLPFTLACCGIGVVQQCRHLRDTLSR